MREVRIENELRRGVRLFGGLVEKHVSPGRRGVPDDLVTWPDGVMQLVETKAPKGKLSTAQERDHKRRARYGVRVFVLWTIQHVHEYATREGWAHRKRKCRRS